MTTRQSNLINELVCPVCGKKFIPAARHIYHDMTGTGSNRHVGLGKRVCSWTCQRATEKGE